jgi:salicylate hydroxylase
MRFEDGTSAEADLVIACDGIHSAVRQQFIQDKAVYSGKFIYRGTVAITDLPSPWPFPSYSTMWIGSGKHVVVYAISANQRLNFVGCVSKSEDKIRDFRESWSLTCDRKELQQEFSDCDELVQKIIKLLPERPSKWLINDRDPLAKWTFMGGKVALLGDAAHAMVPHQSAGGGQAIEDAYIISKALAEYLDEKTTNRARAPGLEKWMNLYQTIRLPRSQRVQETSREAGLLFQLQVPEMQGKSYDESLPILVEGVNGRFKWIWSEDIDVAYDRARTEMLENEAVRRSKRGWCFCM